MLSVIIALVVIATIVAYFKYEADKQQWKAFYIACGGGLLVLNLLISLFFVHKNFRDKN